MISSLPSSQNSIMARSTLIALALSSRNTVCRAFQPVPHSSSRYVHQAQTSSSLSRLILGLSESATGEAEDSTFFARASRQAAKERYDMLLSGEDPFGLLGDVSTSLDSASSIVADSDLIDGGSGKSLEEKEPELDAFVDDGEVLSPVLVSAAATSDPNNASASSSDGSMGEMNVTESQYSDLISTISISDGENKLASEDSSQNTQDEYNIHKRLLEAQLTIDAKKKTEPQTKDATARDKSQTATEEEGKIKGPGCIHKEEDDIDEKMTYRNKEELHQKLFPKDMQEVQEKTTIKDTHIIASEESNAKLPLDNLQNNDSGKEGTVNDENVAMGLLVMTRSLLALKHIVDSKTAQ
jgi:hypothetical protein